MITNTKFTQSEMNQKDLYNRIAEKYDLYYADKYALKYRYNIFDRIFANINLKNKSILDSMCGGGESTGYFLRHGATVTGLDISDNCCAIYNKRYPECNVVCSSILETQFLDNSFDIVITDSLHHLHPYVNKAMKEIYRILKPGGYFCCWEPVSGSLIDIFRKIWYKIDKKYFQKNEKSIDIVRLIKLYKNHFENTNCIYGGNLAYIFINSAGILRIPLNLVKLYAPILIPAENILNCFQPKFFSCWVLGLFRKK